MTTSRYGMRILPKARVAIAVSYVCAASWFWAAVAMWWFGFVRPGPWVAAALFALQMLLAAGFMLVRPGGRSLRPTQAPRGVAPDRPRAAIGA